MGSSGVTHEVLQTVWRGTGLSAWSGGPVAGPVWQQTSPKALAAPLHPGLGSPTSGIAVG